MLSLNQDQSQQESAPFNASTVKTVSKIPLMTVNAGPRDAEFVEQAVKEGIYSTYFIHQEQ